MNQEEKELFLSLCQFKNPDKSKLQFLIDRQAATASVLGLLFWNRVSGIAYDVLKKAELLSHVNREFRASIQKAYEQNCIYNESFIKCLQHLNEILLPAKDHYAMLKGALLCPQYPKGYRTSNDVDLLVSTNHLDEFGRLLTENGFLQGTLKNGKFFPATRSDIIKSKMLRGETVPYLKKVSLPYMEYLEIDINFSLDFKNSNSDTVKTLVDRAVVYNMSDLSVRSLSPADFFLHLCAHLYKESSVYPWIEMKRDMTIYKYLDIYKLLSEMSHNDLDKIITTAIELNLEKECYYTVFEVKNLFPIVEDSAEIILKAFSEHNDCIRQVIYPERKKLYEYQTIDTKTRFFAENRVEMLKEVGTWKN